MQRDGGLVPPRGLAVTATGEQVPITAAMMSPRRQISTPVLN